MNRAFFQAGFPPKKPCRVHQLRVFMGFPEHLTAPIHHPPLRGKNPPKRLTIGNQRSMICALQTNRDLGG